MEFLVQIALKILPVLLFKKTEKTAILAETNLEMQISIHVCFEGFYDYPILLIGPDIGYIFLPASFVYSTVIFDLNSSLCSPRGNASFIIHVQNYRIEDLFSF